MAEFTSSFALIISLLALWISFKSRVALSYTAVMGRLFDLNKLEIERPQLFQNLHEDTTIYDAHSRDDGLSHYLFMFFNLFAEAYAYHEKFHLFDKSEFRTWEKRLENDFKQQKLLGAYWIYQKENFPGEFTEAFSKFVDGCLQKASN